MNATAIKNGITWPPLGAYLTPETTRSMIHRAGLSLVSSCLGPNAWTCHVLHDRHFAVLYSAVAQGMAAWIDLRSVAEDAGGPHAGLTLRVGYGLLKGDGVIVAANSGGAKLSASVLAFKIRDMRSGK